MYVRINEGVGQPDARITPDAPINIGQAPLPHVTQFHFVNTGTTDADNCCASCPQNLGVGLRGTGAVPLMAANGMELSFTISGHRPGMEYDITRTRRNSLWERRAGVWTRLESDPMGTLDDHHDQDECLRLRGNRIFAIDSPGWPNTAVPAADGLIFSGLTGAAAHADATDLVFRFSFAEWVIARNRAEGIPWTRLELPPLRDGTPRRFVFWHSITWLTRNGAHQWVVDVAHSEIRRGALSAAIINSAPHP